MRVFLDVGAHRGQTLQEVVHPRYRFDQIHAFEPMPAEFAALAPWTELPTITLHNFGLLDRTAEMMLYGDNSKMESSIWADAIHADATVVTAARFVAASDFVAALPECELIVKLNCEGSEVAILDNLIDTDQIHRVSNVMIDFDIRKVPGREAEADRILAKLDAVGFVDYVLCEDIMHGETHQDRIAAWLCTL